MPEAPSPGETPRTDPTSNDLARALEANRERLLAFLRLRCGAEGVEDLLHDLWLKARSVETVVENPLAYLYRMADRLVLDTRRGASRGKARETDWGFVHDRLSEASVFAEAERRLLARERLAAVEAALRGVSDRAARIFRRYRLEGVDQRRIAQELGVSLSTVEKDLRKAYDALLTLQERLDEE